MKPLYPSATFPIALVLTAAFFVCVSASAADMNCSIRPRAAVRDADLPTLAKVSIDDARKAALNLVNAPKTSTASGELEIESGCLVYSFDIQIPGKRGIEEVMIDAGNGRVLSHKHETPLQEAAEKAKERVSTKSK